MGYLEFAGTLRIFAGTIQKRAGTISNRAGTIANRAGTIANRAGTPLAAFRVTRSKITLPVAPSSVDTRYIWCSIISDDQVYGPVKGRAPRFGKGRPFLGEAQKKPPR